ncbi:MAG: DUF2779 domain-containing protein [Planctomycetota bacterium]|nr:DUF2779 domain-containing protein [Planctomycetota bacterium]
MDDTAQELFPGGVVIEGFGQRGHDNTMKAIADGAKVLYQPTVVAGGLTCRADIMVRVRGGKWDIYEVKSATKVKDEYRYDVAFQRLCFERAGVSIRRTYLTHINNEYVRRGDIEPNGLLVSEDITADALEVLPKIKKLIPEARKVLRWGDEPRAEHLLTCPNLGKCEWAELWFDYLDDRKLKWLLEEMPPETIGKMFESAIISPERLPKKFTSGIPWRTPEERWPRHIDKEGLRRELAALEYPLHYLDYETYFPAVPPFDGYRPYQQIPFQFSVHVQDKPGGKLKAHDFLAREFADPVPALLKELKKAIGSKGSVIAWNASFEKGRNDEMAAHSPEHTKFLHSVNARMFDPMFLFKPKRQLYVDPACRGSTSLKKVMPALMPDLSYKNLAIQEGGTASASWPTLTDPKLPAKDRNQLHKDMIDYCRLDTYGMAKIVEILLAMAV